MAALVFQHSPNVFTTQAAPGDTSWHQLARPSALPDPSGNVNVTMAVDTLAAAGNAAGSPVFIELNSAASPAAGKGFPVLATQVFPVNTTIWYKLTAGTDVVYFFFAW